jgi:hypothetical protein
VTGVLKDYTLKHNVLLKNSTTFGEYLSDIKDILNTIYKERRLSNRCNPYCIMVWNMDLLANTKFN